MKNQKKLLQLPVDACPNIEVSVADYKSPYTWKKAYAHIYTAREYDNAGDKIIIVTAFTGEGEHKPIFRLFQGQKDYFTQLFADNTVSKARLSYLMWADYNHEWFYGPYAGDKTATDIILKYLKMSGDPIKCILEYQERIQKNKLKEKHERIRAADDLCMLEIKPLPKAVISWIDKVPLKASRYIFYEYKRAKQLKGFCTHCKRDVMITGAKHKESGKCPACRSEITYIALGVFRRGWGFADEERFAYVQKLREGFCIRQFYVERIYRPGNDSYKNARLTIHEERRYFYENLSLKYAFEWENFKQTGEYRFCRAYSSGFYESYIYPGTLQKIAEAETARGRNLKYCDLPGLAKNCGKLKADRLFTEPARYPWLEYFSKLGLYNLAGEVINSEYEYRNTINREGQNLKEILGINKAELKILRKINPSVIQLNLCQFFSKRGEVINIDTVIWAGKRIGREIGSFKRMLEFIKPRKATKWIEKQIKIEIKATKQSRRITDIADQILSDWRDYIGECSQLGYDLTDDIVVMPRNLTQAHARTSVLTDVKKYRKFDSGIIKRFEKLKEKYFYEDKSYIIRPVANVEELIVEGKKLQHCVAGYAQRHSNAETTILLIRRKESLDTPFYTLEWKDGRIVQCRGYKNCSTTLNVQAFINRWKRVAEMADKQRVKEAV